MGLGSGRKAVLSFRVPKNCGYHGNQYLQLTYNGQNVVLMIATLLFYRSASDFVSVKGENPRKFWIPRMPEKPSDFFNHYLSQFLYNSEEKGTNLVLLNVGLWLKLNIFFMLVKDHRMSQMFFLHIH